MGIFLAIGGIGLALLLVSLLVGEIGGHADLLGAGDYLSLAALSGFLAAFGLAGSLVVAAGSGAAIGSAAGMVAGVGVGAAAGWFTRLLKRQQSAPAPGSGAMVGLDATVVSPLPSRGYGEVTLVLAGQPTKVNARSLEPLPVGALVTVVAVLSPTSVQVEPRRGAADRQSVRD